MADQPIDIAALLAAPPEDPDLEGLAAEAVPVEAPTSSDDAGPDYSTDGE